MSKQNKKGFAKENSIKKNSTKKGSIKLKLMVIPLIVVLFVISGIGAISSYFTKQSLLSEMKQNGIRTSIDLIERLQNNADSLDAINTLVDNKIIAAGNMVTLTKDQLSNEFLKTLELALGLEQLSYYNSQGEIIYSNTPEYIGWTPPSGHPVLDFMSSVNRELIEDIREDSESGHFLKYGYLKADNDEFVQIGILADQVQELTDDFSYQKLIEDIALDEDIAYAMLIDTDMVALAHSNKDEVGHIFNDEGSKSAAMDGIPYAEPWYYEAGDVTVYDICYPTVINGEHIGSLSIGYSMHSVEAAIQKNLIVVMISAIVAFILLGFVLFSSSNDAIKVINQLKKQMGLMGAGDFSNQLPEDLMRKNDEFGEISRAVSTMQDSVKDVLRNVMGASEQLAASSQELTATSQQSAMAADEVAKVIEDIANGASDQAKETEQGVVAISTLGDLVMENKHDIENLNQTTEQVNQLKDQGLEILKDLVEKTHISSHSSQEVQKIIIDTNESASKIVTASEMIKNIADQTNLLALNAAIEAARAGDAGRGFAVVADEIRKLAEQSTQFTGEISKIISDLTAKTSDAVLTMEELEKVVASQTESVEMTNNKFDGIAQAIEKMKEVINNVNHSSDEMALKKEDIINIMEQLSAISEENAAGTQEASASVEEQTASMEEIAHSSEDLSKIAEELNLRVSQFII